MSIRRLYFPYCLEQQSDGEWVILNREYRPLGLCNDGGLLDLSEYSTPMKVRSNDDLGERLTLNDGRIRIYLYNDGTNPQLGGEHLKAYLRKLEILLRK
jgi:hypothetical protein